MTSLNLEDLSNALVPAGFSNYCYAVITVLEMSNMPKAKSAILPPLDPSGLDECLLTAPFWTSQLDEGEALLLSAPEIKKYNAKLRDSSPCLQDPLLHKQSISRRELLDRLLAISLRPDDPRYDSDGNVLDDAFWEGLHDNLAINGIRAKNQVRYGLVTRRAAMRTFPTYCKVFKKPEGEQDLDRFMETTLYPGESVAIIWTSKDSLWFLAQSNNYTAWVAVDNVALGLEKKDVTSYLNRQPFLIVSGKQVQTAFCPNRAEFSQFVLDMGCRLPLLVDDEKPQEINGQSTMGNHVVLIPAREPIYGTLLLQPTLIATTEDVHIGYLDYNRQNILRQAFKFLSERYGWGGMYQTRDCASFIVDIFRSFGIQLPRNAGQQGALENDNVCDFSDVIGEKQRLEILEKQVQPGAVLYLDGHVVLYLGQHQGRHYVIHDLYDFFLPDGDRKLCRQAANQVMVSDLSILRENGKSFLECLYNAQNFH